MSEFIPSNRTGERKNCPVGSADIQILIRITRCGVQSPNQFLCMICIILFLKLSCKDGIALIGLLYHISHQKVARVNNAPRPSFIEPHPFSITSVTAAFLGDMLDHLVLLLRESPLPSPLGRIGGHDHGDCGAAGEEVLVFLVVVPQHTVGISLHHDSAAST